MSGSFGDVRYISDGEAVDAAVSDRPLQDLQARTDALNSRLNAAELGSATVAYAQPMSSACVVDMPVAFNAGTNRYEPALAVATSDPTTGLLVPGPVALPIGIVVNKSAATLGDVAVGGAVPTTLAGAGVTSPVPGRYFLSATVPGGLTLARPGVAIPVLTYDGTTAYVNPNPESFVDAHVHRRVNLACKPAGDNHLAGGIHTVVSPDPTQKGWLPANHAVFNGLAPTGAAFGYNIAADPALSAAWPPTPLESAVFFWDKGDGSALGAQAIPPGLNGLVYWDRNSIWWTSNCQGDVPWPQNYSEASPPTPVPPNGSTPECPRLTEMRLTAAYTEMLFATDKSAVTGITPAAGGLLQVLDCTGTPVARGVGEVTLEVNLGLATDATVNAGATVLKSLAGNVLKAGPVVEALVAGTGITLTPTIGTGSSAQGTVQIDAASSVAGGELLPDAEALGAAKLRNTSGLLYLALPPAATSSVRYRFDVPAAGMPASPTITLAVTLYAPPGSPGGALPALTLNYRRLPLATSSPATAATTDTAGAITATITLTAGQYARVLATPISVVAGDTLFVSLARGASDGYAAEVGVMRATGIIGS